MTIILLTARCRIPRGTCYPTFMCGCYTLTLDKSTIEKHFGAKFYIAKASYDYEAIYNAAPSQMLPHPTEWNS